MSQMPRGQIPPAPDPDLNPGDGGGPNLSQIDLVDDMETESGKQVNPDLEQDGNHQVDPKTGKKRLRSVGLTPEQAGKTTRFVSPEANTAVTLTCGLTPEAVDELLSSEDQDFMGTFKMDAPEATSADSDKSKTYASVVTKTSKATFNYQVIANNEKGDLSEENFKLFYRDMTKATFMEAAERGTSIQIVDFFRAATTGHMRILSDEKDSIMWAKDFFERTEIDGHRLKIVFPEEYKGHKCVISFYNYSDDLDFEDFAKMVKIFNRQTDSYVRLVSKIPTRNPDRPGWKGMVVNLDVDDNFKASIVNNGYKSFYGLSTWPTRFPDQERAKAMKRAAELAKNATLQDILSPNDEFSKMTRGEKGSYLRKVRIFINCPSPNLLPYDTLEGAIRYGANLSMTASPNFVKPPKKRRTINSEGLTGQKVVIRKSILEEDNDQMANNKQVKPTTSRPAETANASAALCAPDPNAVMAGPSMVKPIETGQEYRDNNLRKKQEANQKKKASAKENSSKGKKKSKDDPRQPKISSWGEKKK